MPGPQCLWALVRSDETLPQVVQFLALALLRLGVGVDDTMVVERGELAAGIQRDKQMIKLLADTVFRPWSRVGDVLCVSGSFQLISDQGNRLERWLGEDVGDGVGDAVGVEVVGGQQVGAGVVGQERAW